MPDIMDDEGYRPLFDGRSLDGWHAIPRVYGAISPGGRSVASYFEERGVTPPPHPERHPAAWSVQDGELIGEQAEPGYGGYLITDEPFGEFDLALEMRPDWPADTGVMVRRRADDWAGFQVLVDHRPSGGIGGFFGNGLASFSAVPFAVDAVIVDGQVVGIRADEPATSVEPVTEDKVTRLSYAATVEDFLGVWRWADWNELRIRVQGGALPEITTWINGVRIATLDTASLESPDYVAADIAAYLGTSGHIALEVHDNDEFFGEARWGRGAKCRWRNLRIREYPTTKE